MEEENQDRLRPPTDLEREDILTTIGAFVVNAGVVERRLSRGLRWARGDPTPLSSGPKVPPGWKQLLDGVEAWASRSEGGRVLTEIRREHDFRSLMTVRNNVIHGGLTNIGSNGFSMVRFHPDGRSHLLFMGRDHLAECVAAMIRLAEALRQVVPPPYAPGGFQTPSLNDD